MATTWWVRLSVPSAFTFSSMRSPRVHCWFVRGSIRCPLGKASRTIRMSGFRCMVRALYAQSHSGRDPRSQAITRSANPCRVWPVRGPGVLPGRVLPHPTNHLDITATIVELAGAIATPNPAGPLTAPALDGLSFLSDLSHSAPPSQLADMWRQHSFSEFFSSSKYAG